jgi:hypothetical protein
MKKLCTRVITTASSNIPLIILHQLQPRNGNHKETSSGSTLLLAKMFVQTLLRTFYDYLTSTFRKQTPFTNRNSNKVTYSCMENVKSYISRHNKRYRFGLLGLIR